MSVLFLFPHFRSLLIPSFPFSSYFLISVLFLFPHFRSLFSPLFRPLPIHACPFFSYLRVSILFLFSHYHSLLIPSFLFFSNSRVSVLLLFKPLPYLYLSVCPNPFLTVPQKIHFSEIWIINISLFFGPMYVLTTFAEVVLFNYSFCLFSDESAVRFSRYFFSFSFFQGVIFFFLQTFEHFPPCKYYGTKWAYIPIKTYQNQTCINTNYIC